jgi:hypothetical protein
MSVNILGHLSSYDQEKQTVTFTLSFVLPSMEEDIEKLLQKPGLHKFSFSSVKESGTYGQQKRFFGSISLLLDKVLKRKHTAKELGVWYNVMARKYFGVSHYVLGDEEGHVPRVHLSELSKEERDDVTEQIQADYEHLGIDFAGMGL